MGDGERRFLRVGLESSLKPFASWDQDELERTSARIFQQWSTVIGAAERVAVLLWIADGSEILEWRGEPDDELAWASSVGFSNTRYDPYGHNVTPDRTGVPYRDDLPTLRYADVARIVATFKRVGEHLLGVPVEVGATFDAGPEFAHSLFKFVKHPEILARGEDSGIGKIIRMVQAGSVLGADPAAYAGYPAGIPDGTPFGEFLGRQSQAYLEAMGFDYLWLSNGFGFSSFSWTPLGEVYDGVEFMPERVEVVRERLLGFWRSFLRECRYPIEVRGTNFTTGIDVGGDAIPADVIYELGAFRNPPPNSPWGPLNEDFGIELSGYLSRIAEVPSDGFLFRFYANDPWFWQSPWWDFYRREPFDIYLPLSIARLDEQGRVRTASDVQFLTVDTERGELDPRVGREVGDHVLRAAEATPDAAGPLVWLYPFGEYHRDAVSDPASIADPYFEDWYLTAAINSGMPLNTVVSTRLLAAAVASGALSGRVIVAPTRALDDAVVALLEPLLEQGARLLAYGPIGRAGAAARDLLGLDEASGIEGTLQLSGAELPDDTVLTGVGSRPLRHVARVSGGPVTEVMTEGGRLLLAVSAEGRQRAYATIRGGAAWVRGSSSFEESTVDNHGLRNPKHLDPAEFVESGSLLRRTLAALGLRVSFVRRTAASKPAVQSLHSSDNALWLSGYLADTTTQAVYRLPLGAPLLTHHECWYESGTTTYQLGKSFHAEIRCFVDQPGAGVLRCREIAPFPFGIRRSLEISGLADARLAITLPTGVTTLRVVRDGGEPEDLLHAVEGDVLTLDGVTGPVVVGWA